MNPDGDIVVIEALDQFVDREARAIGVRLHDGCSQLPGGFLRTNVFFIG